MDLSKEKCEGCQAGTPPLSPGEARELARDVPQWTLRQKELEREFGFKDFRQSINFVNRVALMAESMDHHPDIHVSYDTVTLELTTHKAGGLTSKDFELAHKLNQLV